jgi:N-methylhydantoinase A
MSRNARLAVDIGGTFTDLVLETGSGTFHSVKILTTPHAPEEAVLEGTKRILAEASTAAGDVSLVIHGTTLATNALIERKGAKTALIATEGFRDSVEIAYEHRFEQYDLYMERPVPLVPRHLRLTVPERLAADGSTLLPLDEAAVEALIPVLREEQVEAVAIGFLHSYANNDHEKRAGEIIAAALPDVAITLSSDVCPEIREYERMSTACANAYVQPLMAGYIRRLESGLQEQGMNCPLLLMMSSGGVTTVETAVRQPIRLVESGPAGGVILALDVAAENGVTDALSFDMGGTTAKLTLIDGLQPQYGRTFEVARAYRFLKGSGLPLRIPVIDMVEIGAGGGSIARVDELKRINVGPDSAGSDPGPACYAAGGTEPTVTDGDVVLGRIDPANFAGGKIVLDAAAAQKAVADNIASALGMDDATAAAGIAEIVDENMASAARVHAVENGKDTAGRTLIAFGGAAPLHAARLTEKLGIDRVIVPKGAGVGSAYGFLRAPIGYEVVRTRLVRLQTFEPHVLNDLFSEMRAEAEAVVRLGAPDEELVEVRTGFMRYRGQGHEITVTLPNKPYGAGEADAFKKLFAEAYTALFSRIIPGLEIEALSWTLSLATKRDLPAQTVTSAAMPPPDPSGRRQLFDTVSGAFSAAAVYARAGLASGMVMPGPAVIVEDETCTVVPAAFTARINALGQIVLERGAALGATS